MLKGKGSEIFILLTFSLPVLRYFSVIILKRNVASLWQFLRPYLVSSTHTILVNATKTDFYSWE